MNPDVINIFSWIYSLFDIRFVSLIAALFAIYFAYQKLQVKICISCNMCTNRLYGTHISDVVISNKRDNVTSITLLQLELPGKGEFSLIKLSPPLVLKGYESHALDVPKYSRLYNGYGEVKIEDFEIPSFKVITIDGKVIDCELQSHNTVTDTEDMITVQSNKFNGIVLTDMMAFIFSYKFKGEEKNTIVDRLGIFHADNPFPFDRTNNPIVETIKNLMINSEYHDFLDNYMLFSVDEHTLSVDLIFSKRMIQNDIENKKDE